MAKLKVIKTPIKDLLVIEPKVFGDHRGFFMETYNKKEFQEIGLDVDFVQDNHSKSKKGVLRGLHFQTKHPQGKLVRVTLGEVFDVAIDLRKDSETFGQWYGVNLSAENKKQLYVPEGFAHGFLTLSEEAELQYKCTDFYYPEYDSGIIWNDSDIHIKWPLSSINTITLSDKDKTLQTFEQFRNENQ